jgi:hypothetical protein
MPPVLSVAAGLYSWALTLKNGTTRTIVAADMHSAITGILSSEVISCVRGAPFDATGEAITPTAASLSPSSAALGSANFTLHVIGTGFRTGCQIMWNGSPEPTTVVSPTECTTLVNMATAQVATPLPVAVRSLGGLESNALTFTLTAAGEDAPAAAATE